MAMSQDGDRRAKPPLDGAGLERAALAYAARYATTRAKLADYLRRKLRERGWAEAHQPPVEALVARLAELGYVDDRAFASAKASALARRGYGARRVADALKAAGIEAEDAREASASAEEGAWEAALRYAERRRIGPFAATALDRPGREKAYAALLRAGHPPALARRIAAAKPGEIPVPDTC